MAMKIKVNAGKIVQIISIIWPSNKKRWDNLLKIRLINNCPTKIVMIVKINNVWSWKNINCSINGEALSWTWIDFHVEISKKRFSLFTRFKFVALFCHIRIFL